MTSSWLVTFLRSKEYFSLKGNFTAEAKYDSELLNFLTSNVSLFDISRTDTC